MANTYVNKVIVNDQIKLDLTGDTISADKLMQGYTAHDASGAPIVGTADMPSGKITITENGTGINIAQYAEADVNVPSGSILARFDNITATYKSGRAITVDLSDLTQIYSQISAEQIVVSFSHIDMYGAGLVLGGHVDTDITLTYAASTGILTINSSSSVFQSSSKCKVSILVFSS